VSLSWRRRRDPGPWRAGNRVTLLENGEQFFPRAFAAIAGAQREIIVETFILFEDRVGRDLQRALIQAANRGVRVAITVDGYGSPEFSKTFLSEMIGAGVEVHVFDPRATWMGVRLNLFRRLHRKLLVVDGTRAFIGGINFSEDHCTVHGPEAKQDYTVELEGPVVGDIVSFARAALVGDGTGEPWRHPAQVERTVAGESERRRQTVLRPDADGERDHCDQCRQDEENRDQQRPDPGPATERGRKPAAGEGPGRSLGHGSRPGEDRLEPVDRT